MTSLTEGERWVHDIVMMCDLGEGGG